MPKSFDSSFDEDFAARMDGESFSRKFWRFMRYLSTRKIESWGFFIAGLMIGGIFL
ncbi:MAG: hypothetical protein V3U82_05225 [Robiginitomaculum sp.]